MDINKHVANISIGNYFNKRELQLHTTLFPFFTWTMNVINPLSFSISSFYFMPSNTAYDRWKYTAEVGWIIRLYLLTKLILLFLSFGANIFILKFCTKLNRFNVSISLHKKIKTLLEMYLLFLFLNFLGWTSWSQGCILASIILWFSVALKLLLLYRSLSLPGWHRSETMKELIFTLDYCAILVQNLKLWSQSNGMHQIEREPWKSSCPDSL